MKAHTEEIQPRANQRKEHNVEQNIQLLADRTNGRVIGTVLRLSVVCDVMYCG